MANMHDELLFIRVTTAIRPSLRCVEMQLSRRYINAQMQSKTMTNREIGKDFLAILSCERYVLAIK